MAQRYSILVGRMIEDNRPPRTEARKPAEPETLGEAESTALVKKMAQLIHQLQKAESNEQEPLAQPKADKPKRIAVNITRRDPNGSIAEIVFNVLE